MNVLADTHAILWWLLEGKRLSRIAWRILENPANVRLVSMASLWEIAIKMSLRRSFADGMTLRMISNELQLQGFVMLPIRVEHLLRLEQLPRIHGDPFDRILVAQALEEGVPLLSADSKITQYPVKAIW
jgi:PIN domain nuclease of toxin-antitoxin system